MGSIRLQSWLFLVMSAAVVAAPGPALASLSVASSAAAPAAAGAAPVLGFQAWKESRIQEARVALDREQGDSQIDKSAAGDRQPGLGAKPESKRVRNARSDQRLDQARLNLEIAQELNLNDYFVLYLNQLKTPEARLEAAKKLSPEETADLLLAYQKSISGADQDDAPLALVNGLGSAASPSKQPAARH